MSPMFLTLPIILMGAAPHAPADAVSGGVGAPLSAFPAADTVWQVTALDDAPFAARGTVQFSDEGRIGGQAPCNTYSGGLEGTPEAFVVGALAVTRMICPDDEAETLFFDALNAMTVLAEGPDGTLILTDGGNRQMVLAPAAD